MMSALTSTSGTPPGGCLIKINRSSGHRWKYAFVMDRETLARNPREENVQTFDVTGWRVRSHTSGFLQVSS